MPLRIVLITSRNRFASSTSLPGWLTSHSTPLPNGDGCASGRSMPRIPRRVNRPGAGHHDAATRSGRVRPAPRLVLGRVPAVWMRSTAAWR